jgi:hypothetical protein
MERIEKRAIEAKSGRGDRRGRIAPFGVVMGETRAIEAKSGRRASPLSTTITEGGRRPRIAEIRAIEAKFGSRAGAEPGGWWGCGDRAVSPCE